MSRRIGLFGGTFDPVHKGHITIAQAFIQSPLIDELLIILTPNPPHKQNEVPADYEIRLKMLQTAFMDFEAIEISTIEQSLPKPSYSYQTIKHLKKTHPDTMFYYCMGEDSLANFKSWKSYDKILEECDLIVAKRPGESHQHINTSILSKTHFVHHKPLDISSSQIRKKVHEGHSINNIVPDSVIKIIEENNLYA